MTTKDPVEILDDESYDPFAAFDTALGADDVRDPYPKLAELRKECPIYEGSLWAAFDLVDLESAVLGATKVYTALSYQTVTHILRDSSVFSSQGYASTVGVVFGHSILEMDVPEHGRYRAIIEQAFNRRAMERWEETVIAPLANSFIDKFAERGHADLVREFTFVYPIHVISGLLGLPEEDLPRFHRWAIALINVAGNPAVGLAASQKLHDYFVEIIAQRREEPREDMISVLATAELDGQRLNDEEICAFLRLLLPAGAETTFRSSGNLLYGLFTHTDQLNAVRDDRSLLPQAIDEGIRWEPPLILITRSVIQDTELAGVAMAKDSFLNVCTGAANHDETRWERPEEFDIFRKRIPHAGFGFGAHVCIGQHLARVETTVALNALFDRLPNLRLDPEVETPEITGLIFRSPPSLPVLFG
ncbi:MAG: cytochrome P450 [Chloroflexi bacterium]|nr:cytochrome P450 [Chloroflexota bacterium]